MPAERYYIDQALAISSLHSLKGNEFHHMARVMRSKAGDIVELVNGKGQLALAGIEVGLNVALFPMIIMTMTIERVSVAWEERGAGYALSQAGGSIVIAALAYLVMKQANLQHLIFVFPELLLVLLAATLVLGRYSGYRLTELFRFRALARDPIAPAPAAAGDAAPASKPAE